MNTDKHAKADNCSACQKNKGDGPTLIFACSGAADVGGIADLAARRLSAEGAGKMFCLAAIGGGIESYLETTDKAGRILAIDGCPVACAKHTLESAGFMEFDHLRLADHGLVKGKAKENPLAVELVVKAGKELLGLSE